MSTIIRGATAQDLDVLVRHCVGLTRESEGLELDPQELRAGVAASIADPQKAIYFVAEKDGQVVGSLFVSHEWSDWHNGWYWWIQGVYVAPEERRQGIYTTLYDAVRAAAAARGDVYSIRLYVHAENPARAAYEAHGMKLEPYRVYDAPIARD